MSCSQCHSQMLVLRVQAGTAIYTVGVGLSDKGEMERVASSSRNVYAVSDYAELEGNVISLRREIKARKSSADMKDKFIKQLFLLLTTCVTRPPKDDRRHRNSFM